MDIDALARRHGVRFAEEAELSRNDKIDILCDQIAANACDPGLTANLRAQARRDLEAIDPAGCKVRLAKHAAHHPNLGD